MKALTEALQVKPRIVGKLLEIKRTIAALEALEKDLLKTLDSEMEASNLSTIEDTLATFTKVAAVEKTLFDSKKFKEENEALYSKYTKSSVAKSTLRITWKVATSAEVIAADNTLYTDTI